MTTPSTEEVPWYCLKTKPKTERLTCQFLRTDVGIEVFCPFIRFERARLSGRMWVTEALFPGYVFACFDYPTEYRHVQATRGVLKIVGFGGNPSLVPSEIIADLRREVRDEETIVIKPSIAIGEEVSVITGPFRGLRAVVSRVMPAKERIALLLEVLGMEREIEISSTMVLPDLPHPMTKRENP